jgi:hypothetical protein
LAGEGDADFGFVVDDLFAGDVVDDAAEGAGERERRAVLVGDRGAGVLAYRDAGGQAEGERDGHRELALAGGFAVDEQLGDAGRSFAFQRLRLPGGFELEAEDVFAGRDFDLGDDLELLLGNVVVRERSRLPWTR